MKNVYFIGIGGIGMSAIARYYNHAGYCVSGYDRTPSKLTKALENEGINIHYIANCARIPCNIEQTLVIYTPAVANDMEELVYVQEKGYKVIKRSRALGEISSHSNCLAVAGTHGKTTTSTLLAHIYTHSNMGCNAFLGGISKNYHSNLILSKNNTLVAEADEFDRSFLQLFPNIAAITSTDADHLDIYSNVENIREAFSLFAGQIKESGALVLKKGVTIDLTNVKAKVYTYSYKEQADFYANNIKAKSNGYFSFDLVYPKGTIKDCTVGVPGWVNVENAIAASAIALLDGVSEQGVKDGLESFSGVERRFDIHVNTTKLSYIDDYAHHPKEISSAISSMRNIFANRKLCAIFQPHLYTRTRDFASEFAKSLSALDKLILLDIYPARELPIEGVSSKIIFDNVSIKDKIMLKKEELLDYLSKELEENKIDILITFGAGDIDRFIEPITKICLEKCK